jgi:TonB family protein
VRIGRRGFYVLIACVLALAGLGWWQWQRSWNDLEKRGPVGESRLRVSPDTMEKRIVMKTEPVYPEAARTAGKAGLVVLDAVIAPDGSVKQLRPVSGSDLLVQSATEAVQSWKFAPYLSSGKAVEVETTIAVEFRLN